MTTERTVEHTLERWLVDGVDEMPDRVYLSILDRVERQPQRRALRVPWRNSHVNSYLKPLLAVAALVVVAMAGFAVLRPQSSSNVGGPATPSSSPSAPPSPSASPVASAPASPDASRSALCPSWYTAECGGAGILPAGRQTTRKFLVGSTFTVPEGWVNDADEVPIYYLFPNTPANQAEFALSKGTAQDIVITDRVENNMVAICDAAGLFQGTTVSELVAGLRANKAFTTTAPVDVTIGGLSGQRIDLRLSRDWTGKCALGPDDPPSKDYSDARARLVFLDTGRTSGAIGIEISSHDSPAFDAFVAEAMPIVESFRFDLTS